MREGEPGRRCSPVWQRAAGTQVIMPASPRTATFRLRRGRQEVPSEGFVRCALGLFRRLRRDSSQDEQYSEDRPPLPAWHIGRLALGFSALMPSQMD
ncbi:hypothetical protein AAFF_G00267770 [Aldrovandia affinis]|uniref:Uncharacterized protein n=1 Tax=Aldrovandia affinis TaxID=143900 RepID=A0AAD7ST87_9TELE|nr:hypothetical protein AAFF_G00267770 [Aldrovandia affinis]